MNVNPLPSKDNLQNLLFNSLNEQGYLLQEACKYELEMNDTGWSVRATEYPVSIMGQDTKIDLVLWDNRTHDTFAIVECKRSDPSYRCWLFGAPNMKQRYSPDCQFMHVQGTQISSGASISIISQVKSLTIDVPTYVAQSWLEVKAISVGRGSNPQNIENAFGQVLRGLSGFAHEQLTIRFKSNTPFKSIFIPVVVTTASLYVAHYDLKDINLSTGKIENNKVDFGQWKPEEQPWILVYYGATDSIAASPIPDSFHDNDPKQLLKYKMRSIFVVNSTHLAEFFKKLS